MLAPLALAQFICSFAGSNMNVMINDISEDLDTTVQGVQIAITIFLLVMAALMIPGGKLTDRYGRKRCLLVGLVVYGIGAAAGPLIGGLITSWLSWRAAFVFQALVMVVIIVLSRNLVDPCRPIRRAPSTPPERSSRRPASSSSSWASSRPTTTSGS
ncbi:MFS transporter [Streptomyces sp. NBC_01343]|uniref:MFS transporter n=1 Tax=Streptomyces sp. NBC_01343 TaxID=2903832 RepID=UPI002E145295|nr:MFS transporter [Streptomyces sp. NBC_01343]